MWIKNLSNLSNEKRNTFLSVIIGVLEKSCMGEGVKVVLINNHGEIIEIS